MIKDNALKIALAIVTQFTILSARGSTEAFPVEDFSRFLEIQFAQQLHLYQPSPTIPAQIPAALRLRTFCKNLDARFKNFGWDKSGCADAPWLFDRMSESGNPLMYWEFRSDKFDNSLFQTTTLVLGGVHPDEITPVYLAFKLAEELSKNPDMYKSRRVIIAPLVNPDGFLSRPVSRGNRNGVDLNRNFFTRDWWAKAHLYWKNKRKRPRYFPGNSPQTEEGTRFQADLIDKYSPDKILSLHAPLALIDYDGPGKEKKGSLSENDRRAQETVVVLAQNSQNYKIVDYPFYPGSLGNYSGFERAIPTITIELKSTNPKLAEKFWREFKPGIQALVEFDFKKNILGSKLEPTAEKK